MRQESCGVAKGIHARQLKRWSFMLLITAALFRLTQLFSLSFSPSHLPITSDLDLPFSAHDRYLQHSWSQLSKAMRKARPTIVKIELARTLPAISMEQRDTANMTDVVQLSQYDLKALQKSHARFIQEAANRDIKPIYQAEKAGIAITADRQSLPMVLLQLRLLQRTKSRLPIEIFLPSRSDFDKTICDIAGVKYGARCRLLDVFMPKDSLPWLPEQKGTRTIRSGEPLHKYLAAFFSSYEDVLVLDASTLVYNNPDSMFYEDPYASTKLVLWPDFWLSSVSERMYKVQKRNVPAEQEGQAAIDLGQFMISKGKHANVLALSIYYSYYGDQLFDHLLMQSSVGERGSMAIKLAAHFYNRAPYVIRKPVQAVGFPDMDDKNNFRGVSMLQHFPQDDLFRRKKHRPAFIKSVNPALNPLKIMQSSSLYYRSSNDHAPVKRAHRLWEWFDARYQAHGWRDVDPERAVWEELSRVACSDLKSVPAWPTMATQCDLINRYRLDVGHIDIS